MKKSSFKKTISIVVVFFILLVTPVIIASCNIKESPIGRAISGIFGKSEIVYQASTRFLYSMDGGVSWSETIQEIPVNSTYYLAVEMQVSQSETTKEEKTVVATITIPSTTVLDCYLDDHPGVSITGRTDAVTNSVSYDFNIVASTSPSKFRVVFECKPLSEGRTKVEVVYDDNVSPNWDATGTIKYVADTEKEGTN
ncbi:MAG: hypothetical protein IJI14_17400 [Anaerolineaceae bacterium]|nr:hypothetical protein [Anaerolineaceae bacterium]